MASRNRTGRRARRPAGGHQADIVQPFSELPPYDITTPEQVAAIHDASMRILEEAGIAFYDDESLRILAAAGASVDGDSIVRFDRDLIAHHLALCPPSFTFRARNPERSVRIGEGYAAFAPVGGPPYVHDRRRGRRPGTLSDLVELVKLAQQAPYLHTTGTETVVPNDVPFHERGLDIVYTHFRYGDKPVMGHYPIGLVAQDTVDMARIVFGADTVAREHVLLGTINVSSPRRLDDRMLGALKAYARANQIIMMTPFILAGAMGPASVLGSVVQANAEALAGIVFAQMVRPGTPCIYGPFLAVTDLRSGAPSFGTAESILAQYLTGRMAREYGLPFRASGGYTSGKLPDSQSGVEGALSLFSSMLVSPGFILHAAGWMESGLTTSYEKFMLDVDLLGTLHRYASGVSWDDEEWALGSILEDVQPGGHHLGTEHTLNRFRTAFHHPDLFDNASYETWMAAGGIPAEDAATAAWERSLDEYEQPAMDDAVDEELLAFMARRRREIDPAEFQ